MAIFIKENALRPVENHDMESETAGGWCVRKWRFSKRETAFAGYKFCSGAFILYSERNEQLGAMRRKMAIFKEGNSVCRVQLFFRSFHFIFRKKWTAELENRLCLMMMMMMMISCWGWWCSFSNRYNDDVVMMMRVYRPFPFWNRSSLSNHFVKWYSPNVLSFGIEGLTQFLALGHKMTRAVVNSSLTRV